MCAGSQQDPDSSASRIAAVLRNIDLFKTRLHRGLNQPGVLEAVHRRGLELSDPFPPNPVCDSMTLLSAAEEQKAPESLHEDVHPSENRETNGQLWPGALMRQFG